MHRLVIGRFERAIVEELDIGKNEDLEKVNV
jgi:hypothetical protein